MHELEDDSTALAQSARAHSQPPATPLPDAFRHARFDQVVRPWMDYFAYWQAFQIAEYLRSLTTRDLLTAEPAADPDRVREWRMQQVALVHDRLTRRWNERFRVFEWLSRMRTVLGASVMPERSDDELTGALKTVAVTVGVTADQMKLDVRDVLLAMWASYSPRGRHQTPMDDRVLHLLRQEIEYAVFYIERVGGAPVDLLDPFWDRSNGSAALIEALPREEELARRDFACQAEPYLKRYRESIPQLTGFDSDALRRLVDSHWRRSRPLRRFVLAFHRLHEQLAGPRLLAEENVIREAERIEQFNLIAMHAERVLSSEVRDRLPASRFPDVRSLARESFNHLLGKWGLTKGVVSAAAQTAVASLLKDRAQLHELDPAAGLRFARPEDINSGDSTVDALAAAFVNFVIARNYAAHHDSMDFDLIYPSTRVTPHPGGTAVKSSLLVVVATLSAR
jgi:hypothetical protein